MIRDFFEALDAAEPWAVFWALVCWLAVIGACLALVRVGASGTGQGRVPRDDYERRRRINERELESKSQGYVEKINRRGA